MIKEISDAGYLFSHESKHSIVFARCGLSVTVNKTTNKIAVHNYGKRLDVSKKELLLIPDVLTDNRINSKTIDLMRRYGSRFIKCYYLSEGFSSDFADVIIQEVEQRKSLIERVEKLVFKPKFR